MIRGGKIGVHVCPMILHVYMFGLVASLKYFRKAIIGWGRMHRECGGCPRPFYWFSALVIFFLRIQWQPLDQKVCLDVQFYPKYDRESTHRAC